MHQTDDKIAYRRSLVLTIDEKIRFFTRLAASLGAEGGSVSNFLRAELETHGLRGDSTDFRRYWLDGKPTRNEEKLVEELSHLITGIGLDFSVAAEQCPGVFDPVLIAFLKVGEKNGNYKEPLEMYVRNLRERKEVRNQIMGALMYPVFVLAAAVCVLAVFVWFVIPAFKPIYAGLLGKDDFPWPTRLVLRVSDFAVFHWWWITGGFVAFVLGYARLRRGNPEIRVREQKLLVRIPRIGPLLVKMDTINMIRTYAALCAAGCMPHVALDMAAGTMHLWELRDAVMSAADIVVEFGKDPPVALAVSHVAYSPGTSFFSEWSAYQRSGTLKILNDYADLLKMNADYERDKLVRMVEPIMIFVLGGIIGFLLIALYMPMFHLIGQLAARTN